MVCTYNRNTYCNRLSHPFKYPFLETNPWISFSHHFTRVINSTIVLVAIGYKINKDSPPFLPNLVFPEEELAEVVKKRPG